MKKRKSNVPFVGTKKQEEELLAVIERYKDEKGAELPVMQEAQEIYGYLPVEVQSIIAKGLNISLEEIYGVATFYSQFNLTPKGKNKISVCLGTACYVRGSQSIFDRISTNLGIAADECTADGEFSLDACRCIGACGLAPVITINDDVYGSLTDGEVDDIIKKYKS
jgi:NADP-reducing hydrogenase subunit HndA